MAPVIAAVGELLVEFVAEEEGTGHRRPSRYAGPFPSGAPAIFIDQAARMGARALMVGAVGGDAFGAVVTDRLQADGVDTAFVERRAELPTGIAFVGYDGTGGRDFVYTIPASAAPLLPFGEGLARDLLAAGLEVVHVAGSSLGHPGMRDRVLATVDPLLAAGVRLSFDPNLRKELTGEPGAMAAMRSLANRAALLLPSEADAEALWPGQALEEFGTRALDRGARAVVLKRGAAGASGMDASGLVHVAAHPVRELDPTGAGDCFSATFVARLLGGAPLAEALAWANAAGALAVQRLGPMEGNSTEAEVRGRLEAG